MKESWIEHIIANIASFGIGFLLGAICEPIKKAISEWIDKSFVNKPSKQAKIIIKKIQVRENNETLLSLMRDSDGSWYELSFCQSGTPIEHLDFKTIIDDLNQVEKLGYIRYDGDKGAYLQYTILK